MVFPVRRMRRARIKAIQPILRQTRITHEDLVVPLFVDHNLKKASPIASMPGQFRYPISEMGAIAEEIRDSGLRAVLLFGIPKHKDERATGAYEENGVVQEAIRSVKRAVPEMVVITDVCACEYTDHGHCGIIGKTRRGIDLLNDPSLELMDRIAVSHAEAGADIVAPSCMLDGMVSSLRSALDGAGSSETLIMSYSTKFASAFYGPFREAADSGYSFGDRTSYQINPANRREAFLESELDAGEGADILMVKPAGFYLDVLAEIATLGLPVAAYQVSGEYAMIKAAAERGWIREKEAILESLICIKRAGADIIISYFARDVAGWLVEEQ
ncbi:MAG: delta-aminolevulinic acid dehydratase [Methanoregula sp. PtaU1.Bin051]|nr:MAG: delta-aminolevulinic acid dehydratase [Methanoregula sp. PtaU1.Bin051]